MNFSKKKAILFFLFSLLVGIVNGAEEKFVKLLGVDKETGKEIEVLILKRKYQNRMNKVIEKVNQSTINTLNTLYMESNNDWELTQVTIATTLELGVDLGIVGASVEPEFRLFFRKK